MAKQDHSYKLLFSHPRMVEDLLRGFVREDWVEKLDFGSLQKVNQSYVSDDLRQRVDDMVWRLEWQDGGGCLYVYLLFEFQSTVDRFMAVRVLAYVALLYQDLIRRREWDPESGKLPPILPLVLYNGHQRWWAAEEVADLIATVPGGLSVYRPSLRYLLLDEGRFPDGELSGLRNVAAALFRLERSREPEEVGNVVSALLDWLGGSEEGDLRRAFATWLRRVLLPARLPEVAVPEVEDLQEVKAMLEKTVIDWTRQWKEEGLRTGREEGLRTGREEGLRTGRTEGLRAGRKEGIQKGIQKGEAVLLLRQLEASFGPLSPQHRARVEAASPEQLLAWGERLLAARTIEEVFAGS